MKKISICVICFNEEKNIEPMYKALSEALSNKNEYDYEIIFEDNDSKDESQSILKELSSKDKHLKVIYNQTNFGPERSGTNCLMGATGDAIIYIACDFQEPPEMITQFIEEWEKGYDIVWGQKTNSQENKIKWFCRNVFYSIIDLFSDYKQLQHVTGFGLMDKKVLEILLPTVRQDPFVNIRNIACEYGFNILLIPYVQQTRLRGRSSYSASKYFQFAVTSLCNTSVKPLHIMTVVGFVASFFSLLIAIVYLVYKFTHWYSFDVGMAPIIIGLFFVSSVQLFCIGMLGEYLGIILRKVTSKPIVVEKERINF